MKTLRLLSLALIILIGLLFSNQAHSQKERPSNGPQMSIPDEKWKEGGVFAGYKPEDEILEYRTEISKTFRNSNGTNSACFVGPVHFKDENGFWQDIDNVINLSNQGGYKYENTKNPFKYFFPTNSNGSIKLELYGNQINIWNQKSINVAHNGHVDIKKNYESSTPLLVDGKELFYNNIYPGINEQFIAISGGIKNNSIWESKPDFLSNAQDMDEVYLSQNMSLNDGYALIVDGELKNNDFICSHFSIALPGLSKTIDFGEINILSNTNENSAGIKSETKENLPHGTKSFYRIHFLSNNLIEIQIHLPIHFFQNETNYPITVDPTITLGSLSTGSTGVFDGYYTDCKNQSIYLSSELVAAGIFNGCIITAIDAYCTTASCGSALQGCTVRLRTTSASAYASTTFSNASYTTYYSAGTTTPSSSTWTNFPFSSNYTFSSASNLDIEMVMDQTAYDCVSNHDYYAEYSVTGNRNLYKLWTTSNTPLTYTSTGSYAAAVPSLRFTYQAGTISTSGTLSAFSSCANTASASQSFTVSGSNMYAGITVTAPAGFEVSTNNSTWSGNGGNVTVGAAGTITSQTIYVRMAALASAPASGNVVCSSSGATSVNVAVSGSLKSTPTVTTTSASSVAVTSASSGGTSLSAGSGTISAKGVCYATAATSTNPTIANSTVSGGTGTANFTSSLTGLTAETRYYYNAYATNECGTGYGTVGNFWTLSTEPTGHSTTFTATAISPSQIDLAFLAASTYGADGYIILMVQGASAPTSAGVTDAIAPGSLSGFSPSGATLLVTVTSNSQTSYSHTTCAALTQYYYTLIPFNWNLVNTETYNYLTSATIPTCTATTLNGPSAEGYYISGNIVNNGTINESSDINYMRMTGSNKTISGTGTWTGVQLCIDGTISFGGASLTSVVNSGSTISKLFVLSNSFTVYNNQTFPVTNVTNYATITTNTGSNLQVGGIWLNTSVGTQSLSNGTVTFNGTSDQSVTSAGDSFGNVTMNNTNNSGTYNGAILQDNMTITGTLTLTQGNIATGSYLAYVSNSSASAVSGGSASSYVWGKLKRAVAGANTYVFPVGKSLYEEASLAFSTGYTSADVTAFFTDGSPGNLPAGGLTVSGTPLTGILDKGFWSIDPSNVVGSPTYSVTLKETGHANGATSPSQYTVIKRTNSPSVLDWALQGTHSNTTQADAGGVVTAVRSALTSFSDFAIAFGGGALPIELTSFQANCSDQNTVDVTWSTASEHNTNYFRVDKSRNGTQWDVLGTIGAAGNSTYTIDYALTDAFPNPGINYYRLTQYDLDGVFETFDVQAAVCKDQQAGTALSSYPNPSSGDFNVDLQTDELEGEGTLLITDAKGAVIHSQNINIVKGTNNYIIQRFEAEPGIYYISVKTGANTVTTKHSLR